MRTRRPSSGAWKYCETVFAFIVVGACAFTLYSTVTSSNGNGSVTKTSGPRSDALLRARLNFKRIMKKMDKITEKPKSDMTSIERPDIGLYFDSFKEWFAVRNVSKFVTKEKHSQLPSIIIQNRDICRVSSLDILIYVHSKWEHFTRRSDIRETWANTNVFHDISVRVIFILGKPEKKSDQIKVINENLAHHDIIQGDFIDSFENITRKCLIALHWINEYCTNARYVLKADDDIFINTFALVEYLISQIHDKHKAIMCALKENNTSPIIREPNKKWYLPKEVYPGRTHYPKFCSGYTTLFTTDLVPHLYKFSFKAPYFSVDDVYMFGYLLSQVSDVHYDDISNTLTLNQKYGLEEYEGDGPLIHVGLSAWEKGVVQKLWTRTLDRMTDWTKKHATIVKIKDKVLNSTISV